MRIDEDRCKTAYGVFPAAKHFPGIGHISQNTDTSATGITDGQLTAGDASLGTFKSATADHVRLMMVSSAMYPLIGPANQAVFSAAVITDLLRVKLGFDEVVITDDVGASRSGRDRSRLRGQDRCCCLARTRC